ncbi:MAG: ComF family protein [Candidatus Omnitrophota bacterium]|nr:ComF family protein [Candidatus Omnitrophota bacterium]MBU1523872.1 ComF family protein [Candidatus Omnitrophota bacterium]MBU2437410.1 ComF family protein [Candidatus Omnitrophota bacterium]MBU2504923.1 ComF family protein [Candidatus Omnitrophota bacterium]
MSSVLKGYLKAAKNIFFPSLCFSCEKKISGEYLCPKCKEKIEFLHPPLCRFCSKPINPAPARRGWINNNEVGRCEECLGKPLTYQRVICVTAYKEPLVGLIHLFKYKNYDYLAGPLSLLMANYLTTIGLNLSGYHFIVPVPIHPYTLKTRGYNQTALLGKNLANYFKIPFRDDIIVERIYKKSQTNLNKQEREKNIKGVFTAKKNLKDRRIILIDDIFTTGATLRECASVLKNNGASNITAITLSKTPEHHNAN